MCNEIPKEKLQNCYREDGDDRSFHDFWSEDIEKMRNVSFNHPDYVGNVLLVVNLASFWGYTPQYYALNALTEQYADKPFKILGFPCNQFLRQVKKWFLTLLRTGGGVQHPPYRKSALRPSKWPPNDPKFRDFSYFYMTYLKNIFSFFTVILGV